MKKKFLITSILSSSLLSAHMLYCNQIVVDSKSYYVGAVIVLIKDEVAIQLNQGDPVITGKIKDKKSHHYYNPQTTTHIYIRNDDIIISKKRADGSVLKGHLLAKYCRIANSFSEEPKKVKSGLLHELGFEK